MKFEKLKPGMVVWDVGRHKMGKTTLSTVSVWQIRIVSVNPADQSCIASWNGNAARTYRGRSIGKWRAKEPVLIRSGSGAARLATREELKAMKEAEIGRAAAPAAKKED